MPRTAWNAPRLCRCALIICVLHIYVHRLEASRDCNAGATEHHGEPAPGSTHNASSARAEVAHLHGDHHPPVNIKFDDPALRYKYDEDGTVTSMEVHAWVRGCVVGFSYLVVVEYPDGGMSWEQDLTMLDGASSLHFVAVFAKPQPRAKHRLVTWVVDTHPGLGDEEKLLAARDVTFDAPIGPIPYRKVSALLGPLEAVPSHLVTVVTQCSTDRLPVLEEQAVAHYGNTPLSVAIYLPYSVTWSQEKEQEALGGIRQFHGGLAAKGARRVTISVLYGNAPSGTEYNDVYPINSLRNLALDAAQTELVLLVDVDFIPSRELAQLCHAGVPAYGTYREMGVCGAALVVPAFDVSGEASSLPSTQGELASLWEQRKADIVSVKACQKCHAPIDYPRWFDTSRPYMVDYRDHFEPYVITLREGLPRYDERFRGHGKDKVSFLYEVSRTRALVVLPGVFLIHRAHNKSESWHRFEGPDRNPDLLAQASVLWQLFQRQVQDTARKRGQASNLSDSTECVKHLLASDLRTGNAIM